MEGEEAAYKLAQTALGKLKLQSTTCADLFNTNSQLGWGTIGLMKEEGFIILRDSSNMLSIADITPLGKKVEKIGVAKYMFDLEASKAEEKNLTRRKLSFDVKNAERVYKTYWLTFAMAVIALAISIYNFIHTLKQPATKTVQTINSKPILKPNRSYFKQDIHRPQIPPAIPPSGK